MDRGRRVSRSLAAPEGRLDVDEGDPSMRAHFISLASFTHPASMEEHVRSANVATAMQVLNAVPAVCDAEPGFATTASLPLVRSHSGFGNADD